MTTEEQITITTESTEDPLYQEMNRLFHIFRLSQLNVRYYGWRTEYYAKRSWWLNVVAGTSAAIALALVLVFEGREARLAAGILAGIAAVLTAMAPLLGWEAQAKRFANLHFGYGILAGLIESEMVAIRRLDQATPEHIGASKILREEFLRFEAMTSRNRTPA